VSRRPVVQVRSRSTILLKYYMRDRQYFEAVKMKNGITLWSHEMSVPFTQIYFILPVGAVHSNSQNPGGFLGGAHLVEHLLFEDFFGNEITTLRTDVEEAGGEFGAWTRSFTTEISISLPASDFSKLLPKIIQSLVQPQFEEGKIRSEIAVIQQENRQRKYFPGETEFEHYQYAHWLPAIAGSREHFFGTSESLGSARAADLHQFHKAYLSNQMQIIVGGDFDKSEVISVCSEIPTQEQVMQSEVTAADIAQRKYHEQNFTELDSPVLVWGGLTTDCDVSTLFGIRFVENYLTEGLQGRLNVWLREEEGVSYGVDSAVWFEADRIGWKITMPVSSVSAAEKIKSALFERVRADLKNTQLLNTYSHRAIKSELFSFQSLDERISTAAEEVSAFSNILTEEDYRKKMHEFAQGEIAVDFFERYFSQKNSSVFLATPRSA
jgi:predicted Zn-dependent peptidase